MRTDAIVAAFVAALLTGCAVAAPPRESTEDLTADWDVRIRALMGPEVVIQERRATADQHDRLAQRFLNEGDIERALLEDEKSLWLVPGDAAAQALHVHLELLLKGAAGVEHF